MNIKERTLAKKFEIIRLFEEGKTQRNISEITGFPKTTIQNIIAKYNKRGTVLRIRGSGRKCLISRDENEIINEIIEKTPKTSAKKISIILQEKTNKTISPKTIQRSIKTMGYLSAVPRKLPLLSAKNIKKRFDISNDWSNWTLKQWDKVIFSDETKINLYNSDGRIKVWRKKKTSLETKNCVPTVKHGGGSLMLWGCMSSNGVGKLVIIDGIMDRYYYKRILVMNLDASVEKMGLSDDYIFQQDNDPKHTSNYVTEFFEKNDIDVLEWPSQSPDLNPIEHLWDHLKRELRKYEIKSMKELKEKVVEIWNNIPKEVCKKLVHSMPKRIEEVVKAVGKHTSY